MSAGTIVAMFQEQLGTILESSTDQKRASDQHPILDEKWNKIN